MDTRCVGMTDPAPAKVRQLRVVVEAEDYDAAVHFFRDVLGMPEEAAFAEGEEDRVAILEAGVATLEIASPAHKRAIDRVEAGGRPSQRIRLAFEVDDAAATTAELAEAGATVVAGRDAVAVVELASRRACGPADHPLPGAGVPRGAHRARRVRDRPLTSGRGHVGREGASASVSGMDPERRATAT